MPAYPAKNALAKGEAASATLNPVSIAKHQAKSFSNPIKILYAYSI
ncbi:hypothetical protein LDG_6067 [Legionella drancourtii LLAP12]|uniref:Uncharacterized protein n=1 Tax=Legionella drancourtii LLAP12 TaxID=658187 RepID=G9ELR6_9GAMM|nr:hypothetical protein LDG_6067 [Legionella drancourtii LLAP12]